MAVSVSCYLTHLLRKNLFKFGSLFAVSLNWLKGGKWQDKQALSAQEAWKIAMSSDGSSSLYIVVAKFAAKLTASLMNAAIQLTLHFIEIIY